MRCWFSGRHFSRCGTLGWTMRILTPGTECLRRQHQAHLAEQRGDGERYQPRRPGAEAWRGGRRMPGGASLHSTGGRAKIRTRDEREAIDAEHGCALHQRERIGERIAQHIPGQAGEDIPARPFRRRQRQGQHQDAARPGSPKPRGDADRGGMEQGKAAGQQGDGQGEQPGENLRLDEKGLADPKQPGQEIAEPEPPADGGGGDLGAVEPALRQGGRTR